MDISHTPPPSSALRPVWEAGPELLQQLAVTQSLVQLRGLRGQGTGSQVPSWPCSVSSAGRLRSLPCTESCGCRLSLPVIAHGCCQGP